MGTLYDAPEVADVAPAAMIRPDALVLCYPVSAAHGRTHEDSFTNLCGQDQALKDRLSLDRLVRRDMMPVFLWHTRTDDSVPVDGTMRLALALAEQDVPFALHVFAAGRHGLATADDLVYRRDNLPPVSDGVRDWPELAVRFLWEHVGVTLYETIMGFLLGTGLGILLAVLLWWLPFVNEVMDPYLVVLNALPKIALGPVLIVWIGAGMGSIIVMAVLISLVVTTVTVLSGFTAAAEEKQFLMRTLGATKAQTFLKVVLPAGVPHMMSALKISVGMSWVGVIVGEYLVSKSGLGYLIVYGGQVFKLDLVMASVVILCLLYGAVALLEKRFQKA